MKMVSRDQNAPYLCDGTSALAVKYPQLTLIEGGKGRAYAPVKSNDQQHSLSLFKTVLVFSVILAATLALVMLRDASISSSIDSVLDQAQTQTIKVVSGDTLWGLAEAHPVKGVSTKDVVSWLKEMNHLEGSSLNPGQVLVVAAGAAA